MNKRLILASGSPRRRELLEETDLEFEIVTQYTDEFFDMNIPIQEAVLQISYEKAKAVFVTHPDSIVIAADTMVCLENTILGKPLDKTAARRMLTSLSNKTHTVLTGVTILTNDQKISFCEETEVTFYEIEEALLEWYISSNEPYDKAGAYGIQGKGKLLVKEIHGDFYNVMGLPIAKVYRELKKLMK